MQTVRFKKYAVSNLTSIPRCIFGILINFFSTQKASAQNEALDEVNLHLRAFQFGLVPVQSALDYGTLGTIPLNTNIEAININTKLANIPARTDVMVGNPDVGLGGLANRGHVGYRNDDIRNLTNVVSSFPNQQNTYFSYLNATTLVVRGFLNLEIGDEQLFLENNELPYQAQYKVEYDLHVNQRDPHYEYVTQQFNPIATIPMLAEIIADLK